MVILDKIIDWRQKHISNRTFLILVAILVGVLAGLAAIFLKTLVHYIQHLLHIILENPSFNFLLFAFPLIGIVLTVFYVQRFRKGKLGKGIGAILVSIAKNSSKVERDKTYSHIISSALTIGFGGSAGLEAPIVVTGAAIGSNTATELRMNYRERTLMLACGVAAGISAIFNSPIAGVLFAVEVILLEFTIPAFIPILISSATASVFSTMLAKGQLFFLITDGWKMSAIPFYILLGIIMGFISVYVTRMALKTERIFESKKKPYRGAVIGGVILGVMIFLIPPLYGEGYYIVQNLMAGRYEVLAANSLFADFAGNNWLLLLLGFGLIFIKIIATSITIGAGGNGGIFAPSLFIGAMTGFVFAHLLNTLGIVHLTTNNFIVVAMAGALSGVVHAPLTAIFLIAEITGGYALFVPLMIVSSLSFLISRYLEPYSIYSRKLVEKGLHTNDKDRAALNRILLSEMVETDFHALKPEDTLGKLVQCISESRRNIFPVLDEDGSLLGIVFLDNVRDIMFDVSQYEEIKVTALMSQPACILNLDEEAYEVMKKFDYFDEWIFPVSKEGKYVGFVSKQGIFNEYRNLLKSSEGEH